MSKFTDLSRRRFLARSAILGCSAAASPLVTPITFASAPWDTRLVVIILRGAMDGLDVVQPYSDPDFVAYRPILAGPENLSAHDLDGFFALHNELSGLLPMWQSQDLSFVHAVSTPYRNKRSHFAGQDLLEAGTGLDVPDESVRDGWLNRMLTRVPGVTARTAFAVGRQDMKVLGGDAPNSQWSPDSRLDLSAQGRVLLEYLYHADPLFQQAGAEAMELAEHLDLDSIGGEEDGEMSMSMGTMRDAAKASGAEALSRFAAQRLNDDTRIAAYSLGGWDTHKSQPRSMRKRLRELAAALNTLKVELGSNWQKTAVLAMTEFGRTARENGTGGTDHGTGGVMIMAGGAVRGGKVFGDWPGLGEGQLYQDRDLMPTGDVRAYAAWAMRGLFGLDRADLEGHIFPDLDMGFDPRILA